MGSLKRVDFTFQNLDSSEISLSDVSHYFDSDPTKVVSGLRTDGKKPTAFVADTTTASSMLRWTTKSRACRPLRPTRGGRQLALGLCEGFVPSAPYGYVVLRQFRTQQ